jgi:hypothetical protein
MEENRKKRFQLTENVAPKKLKLLITVVNKNKAEFYMDYLQEFEINMQMSMRARGTADSDLLHYLGLEDSEKRVLFSLVREDMAPAALRGLEEKFETVRDGKGIAYTVPLSSVAGAAIYQFLTNNRQRK